MMENDDKRKTLAARDDHEARLGLLEQRRLDGRWWRRVALSLFGALVLVPFAAAALGPVPHTFSAGGTISATEMNANFAHLQNAITDVEAAVPSGAVMHFNLATCPSGWSEVTTARGRSIVGLNGSAGTLAGTVGSALDDRENRTHTHSVNVGPFNSSGGGSHNHMWLRDRSNTYNSSGATIVLSPAFSGTSVPLNYHLGQAGPTDYYTDNESNHTHSVNPPSTTSTTASTGNIMPYIQYLVCQRD